MHSLCLHDTPPHVDLQPAPMLVCISMCVTSPGHVGTNTMSCDDLTACSSAIGDCSSPGVIISNTAVPGRVVNSVLLGCVLTSALPRMAGKEITSEGKAIGSGGADQGDAHSSSICIGGRFLVAFGIVQHPQQQVHTGIPRQGSGQSLHPNQITIQVGSQMANKTTNTTMPTLTESQSVTSYMNEIRTGTNKQRTVINQQRKQQHSKSQTNTNIPPAS